MRDSMVFLLVIFLFLVCGCGGKAPEVQEGQEELAEPEQYAEVPAEYAGIYAELESKLEELDAYLDENWEIGRAHV